MQPCDDHGTVKCLSKVCHKLCNHPLPPLIKLLCSPLNCIQEHATVTGASFKVSWVCCRVVEFARRQIQQSCHHRRRSKIFVLSSMSKTPLPTWTKCMTVCVCVCVCVCVFCRSSSSRAPFCRSSSSRPGSGDHRRPVAPRLPFFTQGTAEVDTTVFGTVLQVRCCCAVLLFIVLIRVQNGKPIEAKIHFTAGDLVLNRSLTRPAHGYFTWMLSCSSARFCTHEASQCWSTRTGR